mmetsp:Transcript_2386/g.7091  ORF Transcript_2386/g.7091 Transcript_2386/m.7091 type:complete len:248 (-) Transcript_2386:22-765(-)
MGVIMEVHGLRGAEEVEVHEQLGRGTFGVVHRGRLRTPKQEAVGANTTSATSATSSATSTNTVAIDASANSSTTDVAVKFETGGATTLTWEFLSQRLIAKRARQRGRDAGEALLEPLRLWLFFQDDAADPFMAALVSPLSIFGTLHDALSALARQSGITQHPPEVLAVLAARDLLRCVALIHDCGVLHCDLKVDNIAVDLGGEAMRLRLIDFGKAVDVHPFRRDSEPSRGRRRRRRRRLTFIGKLQL